MSQTLTPSIPVNFEMPSTFRLAMQPAISLTQDQFFELCQQNSDIRMERTAEGELIIMPPSGGESSAQNLGVSAQLFFWAKKQRQGRAFDSNAGYTLPSGANRSPDASWVSQAQLDLISAEQMKKFLPVCPDFLAEVLSPTDSIRQTLEKMEEYRANGAKLGWFINPRNRQVRVYRPGQDVQILDNPATLSGDPELPGFVLDLALVWEP